MQRDRHAYNLSRVVASRTHLAGLEINRLAPIYAPDAECVCAFGLSVAIKRATYSPLNQRFF